MARHKLLDAGTLAAVRMRTLLIEQKRVEIAALQRDINALLSAACGIDLEHEHWTVDLERGICTDDEHE